MLRLTIKDINNKEIKCVVTVGGIIKNHKGVDNIDEIIKASDGIMMAIGDMCVEIPIEIVPIIQKNIIRKCNEA